MPTPTSNQPHKELASRIYYKGLPLASETKVASLKALTKAKKRA